MIPGEISGPEGMLALNRGATATTLVVMNGGDRPVQVGSHYHFAESNPALLFHRETAYGHRLDIPAGTSVRFEPGIAQTISLVPLAGDRIVLGLRGAVAGALDRDIDWDINRDNDRDIDRDIDRHRDPDG